MQPVCADAYASEIEELRFGCVLSYLGQLSAACQCFIEKRAYPGGFVICKLCRAPCGYDSSAIGTGSGPHLDDGISLA